MDNPRNLIRFIILAVVMMAGTWTTLYLRPTYPIILVMVAWFFIAIAVLIVLEVFGADAGI